MTRTLVRQLQHLYDRSILYSALQVTVISVSIKDPNIVITKPADVLVLNP